MSDSFSLWLRKKEVIFSRPTIMGILNVTPDSFWVGVRGKGQGARDKGQGARDKGQGTRDKGQVIKGALKMISEGAGILDVGGESTAPGSRDVRLKEELRRVMPVIKKIDMSFPRRRESHEGLLPTFLDPRLRGDDNKDFLISVDTYKTEVARRVIELGADIINDVTALRQGGRELGEIIAKSGVGVVLMYSKDNSPRTTLKNKKYHDVVDDIGEFLRKRIEFAISCGVKKSQIIVDPGMGAFVSADPKYSLEILRRLQEFKKLGCPVLIGASRKGFIGRLLGDIPVDQRLEGGLACALMALENGADIIRTHDVVETARFFKMIGNIKNLSRVCPRDQISYS